MFDLIGGLPVHALVVHVVVVLLPLLAVVTVVFVIRPRWRSELPWAILGNLLVFGASLVAKKSGLNLQARLSGLTGRPVATWHAHLANWLPYFAFAQLLASVLAWLLIRSRSRRGTGASRPALALAIVLVLVAGGAATVWTYRVGDSGARAVWQGTIANTKPHP